MLDILDDWVSSKKSQRDSLLAFVEPWIEGNTLPTLLMLRTIITHENIHLFDPLMIGKEGVLIYNMDDFVPANQKTERLLHSLTVLYGVNAGDIAGYLESMTEVLKEERSRVNALFYLLLEELEKDTEDYMTDYIRLLTEEARAYSVIMVFERFDEAETDCLQSYLEMEDGRVCLLTLKLEENNEPIITQVLTCNEAEDIDDIAFYGTFFPPMDDEDHDEFV